MLSSHQLLAKEHYTLKNVRLETGFEYKNGEVIGTRTDLSCIEIANGKIKANHPNRRTGSIRY